MDIKPKEASEGRGLDWRKKPRRTFTPEQRLAMVLECAQPGVSV
jgi:transposase-like protein